MEQEDRIAMLAEILGNEHMEAYLHTKSLALTTPPSFGGYDYSNSVCSPTISESAYAANPYVDYCHKWDEEDYDDGYDDEYVEFDLSLVEHVAADDTAAKNTYYNKKTVRPVTDAAYEAAMRCVGDR